MNKKTTLLIILTVLFIPVLLVVLGFAGCNYFLDLAFPNPPHPTITYGEFPFRLEYEINGERIIVEDTIICKFDGFEKTATGSFRKWKSHLASNKNENAVLVIVEKRVKIYCSVGGAKYYMNDEGMFPAERPFAPRFFLVNSSSHDTMVYKIADFIEKYKLKIVDFELSEPIVNTFE